MTRCGLREHIRMYWQTIRAFCQIRSSDKTICQLKWNKESISKLSIIEAGDASISPIWSMLGGFQGGKVAMRISMICLSTSSTLNILFWLNIYNEY